MRAECLIPRHPGCKPSFTPSARPISILSPLAMAQDCHRFSLWLGRKRDRLQARCRRLRCLILGPLKRPVVCTKSHLVEGVPTESITRCIVHGLTVHLSRFILSSRILLISSFDPTAPDYEMDLCRRRDFISGGLQRFIQFRRRPLGLE
jgi:hypothetical protein